MMRSLVSSRGATQFPNASDQSYPACPYPGCTRERAPLLAMQFPHAVPVSVYRSFPGLAGGAASGFSGHRCLG